MMIEGKTKELICGMPRPAKPYYWAMLLAKQKGGSFKDCFLAYLRTYTRVHFGEEEGEKIMRDKKRWKKIGRRAYSSALRIFRRQTPLEDKSGYLPTSKTLDYLEGELVAKILWENGLAKVLFVGGVDLYSLTDLRRLGFLAWEEIQEPRLVVAKEIWPKLKESLDQGKSLDEAIAELRGEMEKGIFVL